MAIIKSLFAILHSSCAPNLEINNLTFYDENLFNHKLQGVVFYQVNFNAIKLKDFDLTGSSFIECHFNECHFENTNFHKCEFNDSSLNNCKILNSILSKSEFYDTNFSNTDFYNANLGWSYMNNCKFNHAKLQKIMFDGAILSDIYLLNTSISESYFHKEFPLKIYIKDECSEITDISGLNSIIERITKTEN